MKTARTIRIAATALIGLLLLVVAGSVGAASPGGSGLIVFARKSTYYDLYTMRADGSAVRRLTRTSGRERWPTWSPDGRKIAFERGSRFFFVDRLGGRARAIPVTGVPRRWTPSWSPDGSQLVFAGGRGANTSGIYTVKSSGGAARLILRRDWVSDPSWSPDGSLIAFAVNGPELYVMRPDGRGVRKVAEGSPGDGHCFDVFDAPAWVSPQKLAFVSWYECMHEEWPHEPTIQVVRLDGTHERTFAAESAGRLVWSADGQWVVQSGDYAGTYPGTDVDGAIVRMRSDGSGRVSLTRRRTGIDPDWQPICTRLGTGRADDLAGTAGDDLLCGLGGHDTITGRAGRDRLFGEDGNDRFSARDGEFDIIGCGAGRDSVVADHTDQVGRDCERVSRS